jgi:hypothetical protein
MFDDVAEHETEEKQDFETHKTRHPGYSTSTQGGLQACSSQLYSTRVGLHPLYAGFHPTRAVL